MFAQIWWEPNSILMELVWYKTLVPLYSAMVLLKCMQRWKAEQWTWTCLLVCNWVQSMFRLYATFDGQWTNLLFESCACFVFLLLISRFLNKTRPGFKAAPNFSQNCWVKPTTRKHSPRTRAIQTYCKQLKNCVNRVLVNIGDVVAYDGFVPWRCGSGEWIVWRWIQLKPKHVDDLCIRDYLSIAMYSVTKWINKTRSPYQIKQCRTT